MRCSHCRTPMVATDTQSDARSEQTAYLCPLCGATAASFRPLSTRKVQTDIFPSLFRIPARLTRPI